MEESKGPSVANTCTYIQILFNHQTKRHLAICDNKDGLQAFRLSEMSQTEKDKYYMWNLKIKKKTNA